MTRTEHGYAIGVAVRCDGIQFSIAVEVRNLYPGRIHCDLAKMRSLCLKCHREATAALRKRLSRLQSEVEERTASIGASKYDVHHSPKRNSSQGQYWLTVVR